MKNKLENRIFILCCALVLTFNGLFYAVAEESTDAEIPSTERDGVDFACGQKTMEESFVIIEAYQNFLDQYFKIDKPSSQQIDAAEKYYRFVEDSLQKTYERNLSLANNERLEESTQAATYCAFIRDQYIDVAEVLLQKQVILSSNSKRTFAVIDGLKATNQNLEDFADEFNTVFPGFFNQFNNALPCYARQCIVQ